MKPEDKVCATPRRVKLRDGRDITIRLLEHGDAEAYAVFYGNVLPEDNRFYIGAANTTPEKGRERAARADDPNEVCLVLADDAGAVYGEAWFRWKAGEDKSMFGICIDRAMQGSGAGRLIMDRLMDIGDLYGPPIMTLTAQVENFRAWKLYTSIGFVILKQQMRPARADCPEMPEFYMERKMGRRCLAGAARRTVNPAIGSHIPGQLFVREMKSVRDDLEINLLLLKNRQTALALVSLDSAGLFSPEDFARMREMVQRESGVPAEQVFITNTHTHAGGMARALLHDSPTDMAYLALLDTELAAAAREATQALVPAGVATATGTAHVGYNRRLTFADGSHTMFGNTARADFTGIEGPDDPTHTVLGVFDENRNILAIVHNNCAHSTCVESADFISADFPGEARRLIRDALGAGLPVLYLQGASGDTCPWDQMAGPARYGGERRMREMGAALAAETLRLLHGMKPVPDPVLAAVTSAPVMGVRMPTEEELATARASKQKGEKEVGRWNYVLDVCGTLRLWEEFHDKPEDTVHLAAIRIGDLAIATNPFELYCQFGLDIRRRSPARHTMISQLTNGFNGYVPTIYGILGGGYSGRAIYWARMEPLAGYRVVEETARLLLEAFKK